MDDIHLASPSLDFLDISIDIVWIYLYVGNDIRGKEGVRAARKVSSRNRVLSPPQILTGDGTRLAGSCRSENREDASEYAVMRMIGGRSCTVRQGHKIPNGTPARRSGAAMDPNTYPNT